MVSRPLNINKEVSFDYEFIVGINTINESELSKSTHEFIAQYVQVPEYIVYLWVYINISWVCKNNTANH